MISVRNRLPPLSGNKTFTIFLLFVTVLSSCSTSKPVVKHKPVLKPIEKNVEVTKPKNLPEKIDTIFWKEVPLKDRKVINDDKNKVNTKIGMPLSQIKVMAMIPFKSNELDTSDNNIPISNLRFVHYYAGMKMALNELNSSGSIPIQLDVFDTGANDEAKEILSQSQNALPQVVIGPYKSDAIKYAAEWAKKNETFVISPWISSSGITEKNPYYFQAKAGLNSHYQLINEHVRAHFPMQHVILISKSKEESKLKLFNNLSNDTQAMREEIISEDDLATRSEPILEKYFVQDGETVFILPMASSKDENYIYHFLRRVMSEKNNKTVFIYGLYKWLEMKSDILEYINTLDVRLSMSNFVDGERPEVKAFKHTYFETYREFPSQDAMEGYDLTKYLLSSLKKNGKQFYLNLDEPGNNYLETQFIFKPIYKSNHESTSDIDYFENKYIKLIEIKDNKFKTVD